MSNVNYFVRLASHEQWPLSLFHYFTVLLLLSITPAFQFNDGGVMNESVDRRHGHHIVREDGIPFTERLVSGDNQAAALITVCNELKQHLGFRVGLSDIADIIQDDDPVFIQA